MRDLIGTTLGHYGIVEQIGAGGMGVVYRAHDERLDRDVAIKVLPEEVASDPDRLRLFEREAKAVARLDHPNILEIHDFGTKGGVTYAVMELLKGVSLREVISGVGVTTGKAVEHARAIANGLTAAHDQGIIHRDLKPENIFLTKDGRIKILDFGLAKLKLREVDLTTGTPTETLGTVPGTLIGTIPYMAPEQLQGQPADHRSDIFALGVVLYEMLTGNRPFGGSTSVETAAAILKEDPEPISVTAPSVPPTLATVVSKCLEKRPEDRFNSAHDLALTLAAVESSATPIQDQSVIAKRWPHILAVIIAAIIGLLVILPPEALFERRGDDPADVSLPRIVVLPFENLGSPDDEYFADGMTDEVRGKLFRLAGLEVIARYSSDQYRRTTKTLSQIAEELSAHYVLTAKVRWQKADDESSRVRVSPELVEVQPGATPVAMWHDTFDATFADVFQVQANIATRVAHALDVTLSPDDQNSFQRRPTDNLAAYDAFLQAERQEREGVAGGLLLGLRMAELYRRAVALDPEFALAWTRLSEAETSVYLHGGISSIRGESARKAAERALEIDPLLPEARLAMASYLRIVENDRERADEQIALGLETAPNHPVLRRVWAARAWRWEDRLAYLEQAATLDPLSWRAAVLVGIHQLFSRRYREAEEWLDRAYSRAPTNLECIRFRTMLYLAQGDLEGARRFVRAAAEQVDLTELVANLASFQDLFWVLDDEWQQLLLRLGPEPFGGEDDGGRSLAFAHTHHLRGEWEQMRANAEIARAELTRLLAELPDDSQLNSYLGSALAYLGREDEALAHGRRSVELSRDSRTGRPGSYLQLQLVRSHIILGQSEPALDLLEPLLEVPFYLSPGWLSIDPMFDPLRDHPRFQVLLEKDDAEK
jgi:serine/threonine protein kinase/tetratricopeptide (TPR) repeat protein